MLPPASPPMLHTRTTRADRGDSDSDRITTVLDSDAFDWHIDAKEGYSSSQMAAVVARVYGMGYEVLPDDECDPVILPDGSIRIYLVPQDV